jgi:nucleoside-diphosphate-sugar epimerase
MSTTRPRSACNVSGSLLIQGPPAMSGAGWPIRSAAASAGLAPSTNEVGPSTTEVPPSSAEGVAVGTDVAPVAGVALGKVSAPAIIMQVGAAVRTVNTSSDRTSEPFPGMGASKERGESSIPFPRVAADRGRVVTPLSNSGDLVRTTGAFGYSPGVGGSAMPVLVTGATGFVGRAIVRHLLASGRAVVALARARAGEVARDRVAAALQMSAGAEGLEVVEGELGPTGCGLGAADGRRLRHTVQAVIHCAGDTSFFPEDIARFRAGHIDGPNHLMRALAGGRLRRWTQLSTAYVCGKRGGRVLESEDDVGQEFRNPYERVKLEAEGAVRAATAALGLELSVLRPSIVVGEAPATAGGTPANLFFDFIRMLAALARHADGAPVPLRIAAAPGAPFNIVPVEYVAAAAVALADDPAAAGGSFHLVVSDPPAQTAMLAMMTAPLGLRGLSVVESAALSAPSPLEQLVARMLAPYREYLEQDVRFDDTRARRLLDARGMPPAALSPPVVARLIDRALATERATSPVDVPARSA